MKIEQSTSKYAEKVSSLIKELAFVGIAIIWLFKTIKEESILLDEDLLISIFALISAVSSQFMQFLSQSLICAYYSYKNKEVKPTSFWYWLPWILWSISVIGCAIGYFYLMSYIWGKINAPC